MLNRLADIVAREASFRARKKISKHIAMNSILFALSSLSSYARAYIGNEDTKRYVNYFGITFAMSGDGKDLTLAIAEELIGITKIEEESGKTPYIRKVIANFEAGNSPLPTGDIVNDAADYIVPTQYKVALQGTKEGMMRTANFYNRTSLGSLNVISTEFGDELMNVTSLSLLTTLWQDAKADGSTNVNEKYKPVNNVPTNILLFGSPAPFVRDQKKHHNLAGSIESGLARRTYFVWEEKSPIEPYRGNSTFEEDLSTGSEIRIAISATANKQMIFSEDATKRIVEYSEELIEEYNKKMTDWSRIKISNIDKIERLAALSAMANMNQVIEQSDVNFAIEWSENSDNAMKSVVMPKQQYISMYEELLIEKGGLTVTEFIERGISFANKTEKELQVDYLSEYAYRKNMQIREKGKHALVLKELEINKLDKMIVSQSAQTVNDPKKETKYYSKFVPFFGDGSSIERIVSAPNVSSFLLAHFQPIKDGDETGHRKKDNFISGENMIAFDIDDSLTIAEAKQRLSEYQYILYTTKSHNIDKNGLTCERFRILIPTKTTFFVEPDEHAQLYLNIAEVLGLGAFDKQTSNVSRLWFTNTKAEVTVKKEGDLLDIRCCLPDTETSEAILPKLEKLELADDDELSRRIYGMQKYVLVNGLDGNRHDSIMKLAFFLKDIGGDMDIVNQTNEMLTNPLTQQHINSIIRSIR